MTRAVSLLLVFITLAFAGIAHAQQDVEKRVRAMNKQAMASYDALEFDNAKKTLIDAVNLLRQANIDDSPIAAKTYLNLGVVIAAGYKDRTKGLQLFTAALNIKPDIKLDPNIATPELEDLFATARKAAAANSSGGGDEEPSGDGAKGLAHTPVDEARANEELVLKAELGSGTGAARVFLLYRVSGDSDYKAIPMSHLEGAQWAGIIPADVIVERPLQYYIEARDKKGKPVVTSGSASNPYIVTVAEAAPGARIVKQTASTSESGGEEKPKFHHIFILAMLGTGVGYLPKGNRTEVAYQQASGSTQWSPVTVNPGGAASAPFHIGVELGWQITNHFALSLLGRFQAVTGANAQTINDTGSGSVKATGAAAGFLRARYRFLNGKFHPYIHVDFGGGEIRHMLNLSRANAAAASTTVGGLVDASTAAALNSSGGAVPANVGYVCNKVTPGQAAPKCVDTAKMGDLFIGGGLGLWYDVQKYVALIFDINLLGGIGVGSGGQSGMNVDFALGLGVHFL